MYECFVSINECATCLYCGHRQKKKKMSKPEMKSTRN